MKVLLKGKVIQANQEIEKYLQRITKRVDGTELSIGLHSDAQDYQDTGVSLGADTVTSVVMVGAIHEFGLGVQPKRPWLSASFKKDLQWYKSQVAKYVKGEVALDFIGSEGVKKIKHHVWTNDIGLAAEKPATQKAKGGSSPMIDTGHMLKQVDYKVRSR